MREQRKLFRIAITRDGLVRRGTECAACAIMELTPDGLGLTTDLGVRVGDRLRVEFALTGAHRIASAVLVTHAAGAHVGGRIVDMDAEDRRRFDRFINEHGAVSLFAG